jgi:putative ABC transport system permease protein
VGVARSAARFPLVVGPKVGPVALVLGSVTRLQDLPASLPEEILESVASDPRVAASAPLLGGHAARGVPILGTSATYLEPRHEYPLSRGRTFSNDAMEAVLGDSAARSLGLEPGDILLIEHAHEGSPEEPGSLRVTGVLEPRPDDADTTIFCPVEAIFHSHGDVPDEPTASTHDHHHDHEHAGHAVSALLIRPVDEAALLSLQEDLLANPHLEVALTGPTLRRVVDQLSGGTRLLSLLVTGIGAVTFLTLALVLFELGRSWTRAVAVLRVMGARRAEVLGLMLAAILALLGLGMGGGLLVGWGVGALGARYLSASLGLYAEPVFLAPGVLRSLLVFGAILLLTALAPVFSATRREVVAALRGQAGSRRASRSAVPRLLLPAVLFVALNVILARHDAEGISLPPDAPSQALFSTLASWRGAGPPPDALAATSGEPTRLEGYMIATDPYTTEDFNLVSQDPRLPRCPFCYRAPTRWERIRVRSPKPVDVARGLVAVEGRLHLDPEAADPCTLDLSRLEVVLARSP